jgi:hypothetical protein
MKEALMEREIPWRPYSSLDNVPVRIAPGGRESVEMDNCRATPSMNTIYIAFAETDWPRVLPLARHLTAFGYSVGPAKALDLPERPEHEPTEADAQCVIAVWSATSVSSAAVQYAARTALNRNALVEIRTGRAIPSERYANGSPIDFSTWEHTTREGSWRALLRRLRPICGAPPKRPLDLVEVGPRALMLGVAGVSIMTSALMLGQSSAANEAGKEPASLAEVKPDAVEADTRAETFAESDRRVVEFAVPKAPRRANLAPADVQTAKPALEPLDAPRQPAAQASMGPEI